MAMEKNKITIQDVSSWAILLLLFAYMFAVNYFMPLHRDDYDYSLIWGTSQHLTAWADVFQSLYNHYLTHGGRMVDFFVLDSFLLLGKQWFNPFNAFLFIMLVMLIYWHALRQITLRFNPYILSLTILFCWLGFPHFAEVTIWMTGACVYLLTAVLIFAFLLPYHFHFLKRPLFSDSRLAAWGMFGGGVLAGWTIENTAATMNFVIASLIVYSYKKQRLMNWMIAGFCGASLGFLLLITAPGNYVRYSGVKAGGIFHFTNQLATGTEMLLYVLPVLLFLLLVWRILIIEYAKKSGVCIAGQRKDHFLKDNFNITSVAILGFLLLMVLSYANDSFFSKWLGYFLYNNVAVKAGIATARLRTHFFNVMTGMEEMIIYLLAIIQLYRYLFGKLALRTSDLQNILPDIKHVQIIATCPICRYAATMLALTVFNNLIMIAAPSFPGRACFGSVVFLIIGAISLFSIPEVRSCLLDGARGKYLALLSGVIFVPWAVAVLAQHILLYKENNQRLVYVEAMVSQGITYLELEPLSLQKKLLRHVYFTELNNKVSKGGFCIFYRLKDLKVK